MTIMTTDENKNTSEQVETSQQSTLDQPAVENHQTDSTPKTDGADDVSTVDPGAAAANSSSDVDDTEKEAAKAKKISIDLNAMLRRLVHRQ
ncbi:MAG: hypothetical protein R3C03_21010 [Pirellulaceae bacterium]